MTNIARCFTLHSKETPSLSDLYERGDSIIKVGTDVRARALGISIFRGQFLPWHQVLGGKFCPGIRFLAIFDKKVCNN